MQKKRIVKIFISVLILLAIVVGFSYARINFKVESNKTNLIEAGCLKISISDSNNINLDNAIPMSDPVGLETKPYTYTIKNECNLVAYYESVFSILDTSNIDNLSKTKVSLNGDSYVQPTMLSQLQNATMYENKNNILKSLFLDKGYLEPNQEKNFLFRMWIDHDVTDFTGAVEGKIIINAKAEEGPTFNTSTAGYVVFKNNALNATTDQNPNYNYVAPFTDEKKTFTQTNGMFKYDKNTYYFRGNVENNYIVLGQYKENTSITYTDSSNTAKTITHNKGDDIIFRIIGINEDGSLKLILNDLIKENVAYNQEEITNILNNWYETNLSDKKEYIKNTWYCEDKQSITSNNQTHYAPYTRNVTGKNPSLNCNDSDKKYLNMGLITIDEAALAGYKYQTKSTNNYLNRDYNFWTISPMYNDNTLYQGVIKENTIDAIKNTDTAVIVPVINLNSDAILTGTGSITNKYQVIGLYMNANEVYTDNIAPTIVEAYTSDEWSNQNKNIIIFAKDNDEGTGISGYIVKTTNDKPDLSDTNWIETTDNKITTTEKYDNGTYYIWVKDNSGNISDPYTLTINNIDKTAPICQITATPDGIYSRKKILKITTSSLDVLEQGYSWDNTTFTDNLPYTIENNGNYTAYVKDRAGNVGSCTITVTMIDSTSPGLALKANPFIVTLGEANQIKDNLIIDDGEGSGVDERTIKVTRLENTIENSNYFENVGRYKITYYAQDKVGNKSEIEGQILVRWPTGGKYILKQSELANYIMGEGKATDTTKTGLYKDNDETGLDKTLPYSSKYYYSGSTVNNYLSFLGLEMQVLNIAVNDDVKIIAPKSGKITEWDTRYIYDSDKYEDWTVKWLNGSYIYTNEADRVSYTETDLNHIRKATFYAGRFDRGSVESIKELLVLERTSNKELSDTLTSYTAGFESYFAFPNVSDYIKANNDQSTIYSIRTSQLHQVSFKKNSYLSSTSQEWTINSKRATATDNDFWVLDYGNQILSKTRYYGAHYRPVMYLKNDTILSGTGLKDDPYTVQENWDWFDNAQELQ